MKCLLLWGKEVKTYGPDKLTIDQMEPSPQRAKLAGHSHFFTRKVCFNGHIAPRETEGGGCVECSRERKRASYVTNKEKNREKQKEYQEKNKDHIRAVKKRYYEKHKEEILEKNREYRQNTFIERAYSESIYRKKNKEKIRERKRVYYLKNREDILRRKREATQKNRQNREQED